MSKGKYFLDDKEIKCIDEYKHAFQIQKLSRTTYLGDVKDFHRGKMASKKHEFKNRIVWRIMLGKGNEWQYFYSIEEVLNFLRMLCITNPQEQK